MDPYARGDPGYTSLAARTLPDQCTTAEYSSLLHAHLTPPLN